MSNQPTIAALPPETPMRLVLDMNIYDGVREETFDATAGELAAADCGLCFGDEYGDVSFGQPPVFTRIKAAILESRGCIGDQYRLELPGGSVEIFATSDANARLKAGQYIERNCPTARGLKLFRFPKEYVRAKTRGMIEIPFIYA